MKNPELLAIVEGQGDTQAVSCPVGNFPPAPPTASKQQEDPKRPMKIDIGQTVGATIAEAEGRVDKTNARAFEDALETLIDESSGAVIVDLESLAYMSSAGLRVLLLASKSLRKLEREFMLCAPSTSIKELLAVSGFDQIITIHTTRAEALASLGLGDGRLVALHSRPEDPKRHMKVDTGQAASATIAEAEGRVDKTNAHAFDDALETIIDGSSGAVIVDVESLSYINSAGLRVLLLASKSLQKLGREFMLCAPSASIQELFAVSGFDQIITIYTTRAEALAALGLDDGRRVALRPIRFV